MTPAQMETAASRPRQTTAHQRSERGDHLQELLSVDAEAFLPAMQPDRCLANAHRLTMDLRRVGDHTSTLQDVLDGGKRNRQPCGGRVLVRAGRFGQPRRLEGVVQIEADERPQVGDLRLSRQLHLIHHDTPLALWLA